MTNAPWLLTRLGAAAGLFRARITTALAGAARLRTMASIGEMNSQRALNLLQAHDIPAPEAELR